MTSDKSLYLPVEGLGRELDGKLLLALVACERGWHPVIGQRSAISNRRALLRPGVFLSHNARKRKSDLFKRFCKVGFQVAVLDEEALVRQTDEIFLMKHEKRAFERVSLLLAWGEDDAELWRGSQLAGSEHVVVTGNPRMDVLRHDLRAFQQPEIDSIRQRFGDYVLMNTNFSPVNHFVEDEPVLNFANRETDERIIEQKSEFLDHKRAIFKRFQSLIPKVAQEIAPMRLVVRPHPSENHQPWLDAVSGLANASVISEGSVVPWIAGARALIHNGCTSAVESAVIGTTILTYRPVQFDMFDNPLPNGLGIECLDDETLLHTLKEVLAGGSRPLTPEQSGLLEHHLASTSGKLSCERIIDALDQLPVSRDGRSKPGSVAWLRRYMKVYSRMVSQRIRRTRSEPRRKRTAFADREFAEMTPQYLTDRIARFQQALNRFQGLRVKRLAANLFTIE